MNERNNQTSIITALTVIIALLMSTATALAAGRGMRVDKGAYSGSDPILISYESLCQKMLCDSSDTIPSGVCTDKDGRCMYLEVRGKLIHKRVLADAFSLPCDNFYVRLTDRGMIITLCP